MAKRQKRTKVDRTALWPLRPELQAVADEASGAEYFRRTARFWSDAGRCSRPRYAKT